MKRLLYKLIKPRLIKTLDYVASYPSRWADGGVSVEVLKKKFDNEYLDQLIANGYLVIEDELIGIDDLKGKVYSLTPKSHTITGSQKKNSSNLNNHQGWFWWIMSIASGVIVLLIGAYIFGIGR